MGHHDCFCAMSTSRTPLFGNFMKNDFEMTVIINGTRNIKLQRHNYTEAHRGSCLGVFSIILQFQYINLYILRKTIHRGRNRSSYLLQFPRLLMLI